MPTTTPAPPPPPPSGLPPSGLTPESFGLRTPPPLVNLDLSIAYQAPRRPIRRVWLRATGTLDHGYDDIGVIRADHIGTFGLDDVGVHLYINDRGQIQWGRGLERAPAFPTRARPDDLVIMIHGQENSLEREIIATLRALLPVINAVHNNALRFYGLPQHHARLGIDRHGQLVEPALQAPPGDTDS